MTSMPPTQDERAVVALVDLLSQAETFARAMKLDSLCSRDAQRLAAKVGPEIGKVLDSLRQYQDRHR